MLAAILYPRELLRRHQFPPPQAYPQMALPPQLQRARLEVANGSSLDVGVARLDLL